MMHYLFPSTAPTAKVAAPQVVSDASLGGFFYDFLKSEDGALVGVRYWVDDQGPSVLKHPVFAAFVDDDRFAFNPSAGYVDIVFEHSSVAALRHGKLSVETVQEFGGDQVVRTGDFLGIAFDV